MKYFTYQDYKDEFTTYTPNYKELVTKFSDNIIEVDITDDEVQDFITAQKEEINVQEITEQEFKSLFKETLQAKRLKDKTREDIRNIKDLEDDFIDNKIITQNILYLLSDIWINVFTEEQKENSKYKSLMDTLALLLSDEELILRADLDGPEKLMSILNDEKDFAKIAADNYISRIR